MTKHILIADDSSIIRKIIRQDLERGGYEISEAENGLDVLTRVSRHRIDLITLDIEMPRMNGFETYRKLRSTEYLRFFRHIPGQRVPVVFVTGTSILEDRLRGFSLGAVDFITKPFPRDEVLNTVGSILTPVRNWAGLTVLTIISDKNIQDIVSTLLSREGVNLICVESMRNGYEILKDKAADIDMVILDSSASEINCKDPSKTFAHNFQFADLPHILMTPAVKQDALIPYFKAGISDYLIKPFFKEEFLARLSSHIERKRLKREIKNIKSDLTKSKSQVEYANQAKTFFLSNISHEIRTPMNAIIGLTELALRIDSNPQLRDYLAKIYDSSHSLMNLLSDMLDFSSIEAGKIELRSEEFNLDNLLGTLVDIFSGVVTEKRLELYTSIDRDVPHTLIGDPRRLGQVFINLVDNAVKFTEKGEICISVNMENRTADRIMLMFSVHDTGIGIDPQQKPKLFTTFTQIDGSTTRKYGGTGLGLALSKKLVEMMNGKIWVESVPKQGSTFYFTGEFINPFGDIDSIFSVPEEIKDLKTLIIADRKASRDFLSNQLHMYRLHTCVVSSLSEALTEILSKEKKSDYKLIIVDLINFSLDMITKFHSLMERLSSVMQKPKVIQLININQNASLTNEHRGLIDALIIKPLKPSRLITAIFILFNIQDSLFVETMKEEPAMAGVLNKSNTGAKVLLVEDNVINQQVASEMLKGLGITVHVANNGREAVEAVKAVEFDALLMDIQMPEMDGYQATAIIRKELNRYDLPIIALTAHAMTGDREKCLEAGMDDYIAKPISIRELRDVLCKCLKNSRTLVPLPDRSADAEVSSDDVPFDLPGIETSSGLKSLGDNMNLYKKLLFQFHDEFLEADCQMRDSFVAGNVDECERLAHNIKGVSGLLGALILQESAKNLEFAFKQGDQENYQHLMHRFDETLHEALSSVELLNEPPTADASVQKSAHKINKEALTPYIINLHRTLRQSELIEDDFIETMSGQIGHSELCSDFNLLLNHVDSFDYDSALSILKDMAAKLDISLEE